MKHPLKWIQVLRGFAAIAVLMHHAGVFSEKYLNVSSFTFSVGSLGVDFFFTLSGFIITYIHHDDVIAKGNVKNFLLKRFWRVFPFYWLTLIVVLLLNTSELPGWQLLIKNLVLFRLPMSDMLLPVAWSLTFEIVFYLLFALAIAIGWKVARWIVIVWVLLILLPELHIAGMQVVVSNLNIEFLCGCLAAYMFTEHKIVWRNWVFVVGAMVIGGLILMAAIWGFDRFSIVMTTLMGLGSGWIILHAAMLDRERRHYRFAFPVLLLAGNASYAIYLTHTVYMPYLFMGWGRWMHAYTYTPMIQIIGILVILLVSIGIGIIIHLLVERRLLAFGKKWMNH